MGKALRLTTHLGQWVTPERAAAEAAAERIRQKATSDEPFRMTGKDILLTTLFWVGVFIGAPWAVKQIKKGWKPEPAPIDDTED